MGLPITLLSHPTLSLRTAGTHEQLLSSDIIAAAAAATWNPYLQVRKVDPAWQVDLQAFCFSQTSVADETLNVNYMNSNMPGPEPSSKCLSPCPSVPAVKG